MRIDYVTPCATENLANIRGFVAEQLLSTQFSQKERDQIVLAIDEACANAIIHGNKCDCKRQLKIELDIDSTEIKIEIFDIGNFLPTEIKALNNQTIQQNIKNHKKGGLGLHLIKLIMDEICFYERGNVKVCSLKKNSLNP